jgi:hypothetical protein
MQNQRILFGVIIVLAVVIGLLVYDRQSGNESLGEKVGNTIDHATGERNGNK